MRLRFIIVSFLVFIIQTTGYASTNDCAQQQCAAVIDVGSTGSRIHLYSYDLDNTNTPIKITERWSKKINPGFATIEANKVSVDDYLTKLFAGSPAHNIPVYFFATAGMRLLSKPKQQQFYTLVQEWFNEQYDFKLVASKTITGSEEGLYGWLAVNYQLGTLTKDNESVGVLDMGGASVQVVFPIKNANEINDSDVQQLDLYGHHLTLFTHSFLGLGQNEFSHQFLDSTPCFATNYELSTGQPAKGNAYACRRNVSSLINKVHKVNQVIQPVLSANPVNNWYAMGGLISLAKNEPFNFTNNKFTSKNFLKKAHVEVCEQEWSVLSSQHPNDSFLYGACLFSSFYYALIVDGYGIQPQQKLNYLRANQNSDWTMGVILH